MFKLIFQHGWGFDNSFFTDLRKHLSEFDSLNSENRIGIGHSLGFNKLLEMSDNWSGLISISGFVRFVQTEKTRDSLTKMIAAFKKDPIVVLKSFYKNCGINFPLIYNDHDKLNKELLLKDLENLSTIDNTYLLQKMKCPILALHAIDDKIVNYKETEYDFYSHKFVKHTTGNHALGLNQVEWCAQEIRKFINERSYR